MLFRISRNGHVNVSPRERVAALHTLNAWVEDGREMTLPKPEGKLFYDATLPLDAQSSRVTLHADGHGFDARVMEVNGCTATWRSTRSRTILRAAGIKAVHVVATEGRRPDPAHPLRGATSPA